MTLTHQRGLTEPVADAAIDQACRMLRLPTLRQQFTAIADAADREQLTYCGFLAELLMAECEERQRRRSERRIKAAGFPRQKWLKDFDFQANPNIQPAAVHTLSKCEWVRHGHPLCLIGDSGTGKSDLLIALGTEAAMAGFGSNTCWPPSWSTNWSRPPTSYSSTRPSPATAESTCSASMSWATWNSTNAAPTCSPPGPHRTRREGRRRRRLQREFRRLDQHLHRPRLCGAIVDRLTVNATVIETGSDSYRMAHTRARQATEPA